MSVFPINEMSTSQIPLSYSFKEDPITKAASFLSKYRKPQTQEDFRSFNEFASFISLLIKRSNVHLNIFDVKFEKISEEAKWYGKIANEIYLLVDQVVDGDLIKEQVIKNMMKDPWQVLTENKTTTLISLSERMTKIDQLNDKLNQLANCYDWWSCSLSNDTSTYFISPKPSNRVIAVAFNTYYLGLCTNVQSSDPKMLWKWSSGFDREPLKNLKIISEDEKLDSFIDSEESELDKKTLKKYLFMVTGVANCDFFTLIQKATKPQGVFMFKNFTFEINQEQLPNPIKLVLRNISEPEIAASFGLDSEKRCKVCYSKENLQKCSRCKLVSYCGKEHQKADWKEHKLICKEND